MSNGELAYLFQSAEVLPLQEFSPYTFQLKKNKNTGENSGRVIANRLPLPAIGPIKPDSRSENAKVYSEIIVYI